MKKLEEIAGMLFSYRAELLLIRSDAQVEKEKTIKSVDLYEEEFKKVESAIEAIGWGHRQAK